MDFIVGPTQTDTYKARKPRKPPMQQFAFSPEVLAPELEVTLQYRNYRAAQQE